jgi:hypothetical protein
MEDTLLQIERRGGHVTVHSSLAIEFPVAKVSPGLESMVHRDSDQQESTTKKIPPYWRRTECSRDGYFHELNDARAILTHDKSQQV